MKYVAFEGVPFSHLLGGLDTGVNILHKPHIIVQNGHFLMQNSFPKKCVKFDIFSISLKFQLALF